MDKGQKTKTVANLRRRNVLESIKDLGSGVGQSIKEDLLTQTSEEFLKEIFGTREKQNVSGDLVPGESLSLADLFSGQAKENDRLRAQISVERGLHEAEKTLVQERSNELKLQLHALMQEVMALAKSTQKLGEEVEIASLQAPASPGIYHLVFFEKVLEFLKSFRQKIEEAALWLQSSNKRAEKKNYWAMYKKKGSSFLLAPDHYLQRSAG
jgi:hypothetical protein